MSWLWKNEKWPINSVMLALHFLSVLFLGHTLCGGCSPTDGNQQDEQASPVYLRDDKLSSLEVSYQKGRCLARLSIDDKSDQAQQALLSVAGQVAATIPASRTSPAGDRELVALIPVTLAGWSEDLSDRLEGPWLVTTNAHDWINGSGDPFQDNGFLAVAGESYGHLEFHWKLHLEVVNMGSPEGALTALHLAGWDQGTAHEE